MTCWDILNIEPTANKKLIKQAYAKLLKHNKPDQNPEGFSQLHAAYKHSLQAAEAMNLSDKSDHKPVVREYLRSNNPVPSFKDKLVHQDSEPLELAEPPSIEPDLSQSTMKDDIEIINNPIENKKENPPILAMTDTDQEVIEVPMFESEDNAIDEDSYEEQAIATLQQAWESLNQKSNTAFEMMRDKKDPQIWHFLETEDALYDIEFKTQFSEHLFSLLVLFFEQNKIKLHARSDILQYLNDIFHWTDYSDNLEQVYGYERIESLLNYMAQIEGEQTQGLKWLLPKQHVGQIEYGGYYKRIAATFMDWLIVYVAFTSLPTDSLAALGIVLIAYLVITPIMECSPLQGTPGKILFGLKVASPKGKRLNIFHALWRMLIFALSTAGAKVTVWINFFINDGRLLHDRLSYSIVINR